MSTSAVFPPLPLPIYLSPMSDVSTSSRITSSSRTSSSRSSTRSATSTSTRFPTSTSNGSLSSNPFDFFKTPGALPGIIVGAVVLIGILAALTRRQIRRRNAAAYTTATLFPSTNSTNYYPPLPQQSYLAHNSNPNPYAPDHYPTAQTPNSSPYMSGVGPAASFTPPPSQSAYNQNVGSGWAPPLEPIYHHPQPCLRTNAKRVSIPPVLTAVQLGVKTSIATR
ncbi:hypothetical protein MKEN_00615100 [Mycena kentingensis (nom. inval.)]|nr:hypothetical protein MKEN_00615100 [Mycena kentingensis (nom. inval.)]